MSEVSACHVWYVCEEEAVSQARGVKHVSRRKWQGGGGRCGVSVSGGVRGGEGTDEKSV